MKIQSSTTAVFEFTPISGSGEKQYQCPECSHLRKKKTDKCFSWNQDKEAGYCHHCNASFWIYKPHEPRQYNVPEWKNITELTDGAVKWFTGRMISQNTLKKMKVYSDTVWMPVYEKETGVVCFPYFYKDKLINIKYRTKDKKFKFESGATDTIQHQCVKRA